MLPCESAIQLLLFESHTSYACKTLTEELCKASEGGNLIEVPRALRIKQRIRQGCMLLDGQLGIAREAPEPGQDAHHVGVHHRHMLPAGNGGYGVACVGADACSSSRASCENSPEESKIVSSFEELAQVMRTDTCTHEVNTGTGMVIRCGLTLLCMVLQRQSSRKFTWDLLQLLGCLWEGATVMLHYILRPFQQEARSPIVPQAGPH